MTEPTIHPKARIAFNAHRSGAKKRGIEFLFTFDEWWAWWQIDGRWARRGSHQDQLVMARIGDGGAYEPGNVQCITNTQNGRDWSPEKRLAAIAKRPAKASDAPKKRGRPPLGKRRKSDAVYAKRYRAKKKREQASGRLPA